MRDAFYALLLEEEEEEEEEGGGRGRPATPTAERHARARETVAAWQIEFDGAGSGPGWWGNPIEAGV